VLEISQKYRCGLGSAPDPAEELVALPRSVNWIVGGGCFVAGTGGEEQKRGQRKEARIRVQNPRDLLAYSKPARRFYTFCSRDAFFSVQNSEI